MECLRAREAISATLDGEDPGVGEDELTSHVTDCAECTAWRDAAAEVTRRVRMAPSDLSEDLPPIVAVGARRPGRWREVLRWVLAAVAACQLAVAGGQLFAVDGAAHGMGHVGHETAAFNFAVAVALGWAARGPGQARSQLPMLFGLTVVLAVLSVADLVNGHVEWSRLAGHVPLVVGVVCVALFGGRVRRSPPPVERSSGGGVAREVAPDSRGSSAA
ncbi:putative anti-sigma-YlaC factor YlaD [Herbihabitans rhizosphaerae]|uniref:Putative anti-sigma-YlaC factor YlaD n=1 Tax=Herbihabitans rhizosphaerae TaxID=1872711 RepID=A0A4Q7L771_9PSEU|nr:hypothetical protein [Herbihabitans rhizosphaerae]RZS44730.1 putative anti-sigma-YlaC factor YlaD [Herbihabitans rhizosphaerae]